MSFVLSQKTIEGFPMSFYNQLSEDKSSENTGIQIEQRTVFNELIIIFFYDRKK